MEKIKMVFLFQVMPQSSPILCVEVDEFGPLLEVIWLHTHSFIGDGESTRASTHPFVSVIIATFC
jgi:ligand-binding SRPBCC domain-containing protein